MIAEMIVRQIGNDRVKVFFSAIKKRASTEVNEADRFLNDGSPKTSLKDLDRFPTIKKIVV